MEQNKPQTEQELTQQAAVRRQHAADGALTARSWQTCAKPVITPLKSPNMRRMRTRPTSKMSLLTFLPRLRPERSSLWLAA